MDLKIIDNGDGGDLVFNGKDLVVIDGWQNMPYLDLFGGNKEASTDVLEDGEQSFDWWGNRLFFEQTPDFQYNSNLERALGEINLTSAGRVRLHEIIKSDLEDMTAFATLTVETSIVSTDRLSIFIKVVEPTSGQEEIFNYIWDATQQELI